MIESKSCPAHGGPEQVRRGRVDPRFKTLELWHCDQCQIGFFVEPGKPTGNILGNRTPEMRRIILGSLRKNYRPPE